METRYNSRIWLYPILLLGIGLRLYKLGANSLWGDEAAFILVRSGGFIDSLRFMWRILLDRHTFVIKEYGYNLLATAWSFIAKGDSMLRLSSVIFGVLSIVLIYKVGKLLFDEKTGIMSALILAISPFHIYYSQEFRMYTLISVLSLASAYFLRRFQKEGKYKYLIGYAVSHTLNFYINMVTVLIYFAESAFFVFYRKKYRAFLKKWLIANIGIILLFLPGVILMVRDLIYHGETAKIMFGIVSPVLEFGSADLLIPLYTFKNFWTGYNVRSSIWVPALLLLLILFIWAQIKTKNRESLQFCLFCLFIPVLIMYAGQRFSYTDRYLIPSSLFLYLIAGNGIAYLKKPAAVLILTFFSLAAAFSLNNYYKNYLPCPHRERFAVHEKKANREAAAYIFNNFQEGDIIFHTHNHTILPFEYYFNYVLKKEGKPARGFNREQVALVIEFSEDRSDLASFKGWESRDAIFSKTPIPVDGHDRIWLVFSAREFKEACNPGSPEKMKLEWLRRHYIQKEAAYFKGINLYLFLNPQSPR